jgi:L-threonylcarbamoyladenylate synthase
VTELRLLPRRAAALPEGVAGSLRRGGTAVFPTDTLYGLGADPASPEGVEALFRVKGREAGKAVPLLLDGAGRIDAFASSVPEAARLLAAAFWPGPLTLVLPASPRLLPALLGGGPEVGLRVPDHPLARALAAALGGAVTGTSANRSGEEPRWGSADALLREFGGEVDWILWEGPLPPEEGGDGAPSTVVRFSGDRPVLLREGAVPFDSIVHSLQER